MYLINCHSHSLYSGHGEGSVLDQAKSAFESGIQTFCFTEHLPLPHSMDPQRKVSIAPELVETYLSNIESAQEFYPEMDCVKGFEADYYEGCEKNIAPYKQKVSLLLGSVHFLGTWNYDNSAYIKTWDNKDVDQVYYEYFETWLKCAHSNIGFDVLSHPDLIKKFGHKPSFNLSAFYQKIVSQLKDTSVRYEISTAGLRAPVKEIYPSFELGKELYKAGIPCVISTDSHRPQDVDYKLAEAYEYAKSLGYTSIEVPLKTGGFRTVQI